MVGSLKKVSQKAKGMLVGAVYELAPDPLASLPGPGSHAYPAFSHSGHAQCQADASGPLSRVFPAQRHTGIQHGPEPLIPCCAPY